MTSTQFDTAPVAPLDLDGIDLWIVEQGLLGSPLDQQMAGYCQRIHDSGFPVKRVQMGMGALHPQYGAYTFVWRPNADAVEHAPRERTIEDDQAYLQCPVHYMRSKGVLQLRRRLDGDNPNEFFHL